MPPKRSHHIVKAEYEATLRDAEKNDWNEKLNCYKNPGPFIDYVVTPTPAEAEVLCHTLGSDGKQHPCPMLALCDEYAVVIKPDAGVWGGRPWREGRRYLPITVVQGSAVAA